jgi:hypothetical protein
MKLSSLLGSIVHIWSKSHTAHHNRVYLLNFTAATQDFNHGITLHSSVGTLP